MRAIRSEEGKKRKRNWVAQTPPCWESHQRRTRAGARGTDSNQEGACGDGTLTEVRCSRSARVAGSLSAHPALDGTPQKLRLPVENVPLWKGGGDRPTQVLLVGKWQWPRGPLSAG